MIRGLGAVLLIFTVFSPVLAGTPDEAVVMFTGNTMGRLIATPG